MKKVLLSLAVLMTALVSSAQLPSGSVAPDFTGTDLNGNQHNLYDLLDQGYSVVIDVSATWCGPCWNYHQSGVLEEIYNEHGPEGDQTIMVLWIEGDATTNTDCLYSSNGCNSSTQGDWVTGTPFPIIDDASIADLYAITYFPTTFLICPNRIIVDSQSIQPSVATINSFLDDCEVATFANDPAILGASSAGGDCLNADVTLTVVLQNMGTSALTAATIQVTGGVSTVTENWTGNLATYATTEVEIPVAMNGAGTLNITITSADQNPANSSVALGAGVPTSTSNVRIEYATDEWPEEFSWIILDENGNIAAEGGPYATGAGPQDPVIGYQDIWLDATGCYTFIAIDGFGDGLHGSQWGGTDGSISVYGLNNGNPQYPWYDYDGSYDYEEDAGFGNVNQVVSVNDNEFVSVLNAYPNPTADQTTINFSIAEAGLVQIEVVNLLGEVMMVDNLGNLNKGSYNQIVDMSNLSAGVYMVNIRANGNLATLRVNLTK
ncbi:MAG: hypothetical protein RL220_2091 [Bacteroidota bacterium]